MTSAAVTDCQVNSMEDYKLLEQIDPRLEHHQRSPSCRMISTEVRIKELENLAALESVTIYGKVILAGVPEQAEVKHRW